MSVESKWKIGGKGLLYLWEVERGRIIISFISAFAFTSLSFIILYFSLSCSSIHFLDWLQSPASNDISSAIC